jgi:CRP-like cAMP-binding protein
MEDNRADGDSIHLTHEFLALMLGARRASVTLALGDLQKRKVLRAARGCITIQNRPALEEAANGSC